MTTPVHRWLLRDDMSAHQGWVLTEWCHSIGGDEFILSCLSDDSPAELQICDDAFAYLEPFAKGEAMRDTVSLRRERVPVWGLTPASLAVLRQLLPDGIFSDRSADGAWLENLTIYRRGEMLLGVVTHEESASLCLSESEWQQFGQLGICTHEPSA